MSLKRHPDNLDVNWPRAQQRKKAKYVSIANEMFHFVGTAEILYYNNFIFQEASICWKSCPKESHFSYDLFGKLVKCDVIPLMTQP